ncbi:MAG: anaerobic ribonucleoside-triphosphate reductase activating protein [Clostridiales bacterium]|nr:anaerobic ribonucleoside-triphosphate reductase activating protein [Clostridiales bacterium]
MSKLRISQIINESIVDGPGIRTVIFVQGCPHKCKGCHNSQTHGFYGGYYLEISEIIEIITKNKLVEGITFSGGEPFCQANEILEISKILKKMKYHITIYSGYTFEELINMGNNVIKILKNCNLLIDGKYDETLRDLTLKFRGSKNQRIIDVQKSLSKGRVFIYD